MSNDPMNAVQVVENLKPMDYLTVNLLFLQWHLEVVYYTGLLIPPNSDPNNIVSLNYRKCNIQVIITLEGLSISKWTYINIL
jgi:hypothetical protein